MYTTEELKKMKKEQLEKALKEGKTSLMKFRFESRTGQSKNHQRVEDTKKYVARVITILKNVK
ncbi:MAG: hypothetical protein US89_C0017G0048 [Candidatus Peregrinibacteria bacterium GW2011_GWF2_38_29]|nr:MAG: hypothetical protein US89_C0017G0048 [Candidatus Peregrinibacteria bacterium GW2011_GWF2_38_29]HBB02519.1 50S ribosomal protein L29 [Candidatus Peregrinibacteria bacterium]